MLVPRPPIAPSDLSESVEIWCVDPALAPRVWRMVKAQFAAVLEQYPTDTTIEAMENDVFSGLQLVWIATAGDLIVAAATTALCATPSRKFCSIVCVFGVNTRLWDRFIPMIEAYARAEGCHSLRVQGRKGWASVLKGFSQPWIVLDKELR